MKNELYGGLDLDSLVRAVTLGTDIPTWCKDNSVDPYDLFRIMGNNKDISKMVNNAHAAYADSVKNRIINTLGNMITGDARDFWDSKGNLLPPSEWGDRAAKMVAGFEMENSPIKVTESGMTVETPVKGKIKKVKLTDRLKAIELMMRHMGMLVDKVEVSGTVTLEDMVVASMRNVTPPTPNRADDPPIDAEILERSITPLRDGSINEGTPTVNNGTP